VYAHRLEAPRLQEISKDQLHWVDDGDCIDLGDGVQLHVLHTPGHTQGSISFVSDTALFVGDAFLDSSETSCTMYVSDAEAFGMSLAKLATEAERLNLMVCAGHGAAPVLPSRLREAEVAFAGVVKKGMLNSCREQVVESCSWRDGADWCWAEWDDWLGAPIVQAGRDFAFVQLTAEHDK
jgi:glyoxylase-like metal-dependent hydrolase (beta-lactamase superfamily II)